MCFNILFFPNIWTPHSTLKLQTPQGNDDDDDEP